MTHLRISPRRHEQIKAIALARGQSIADFLADAVRNEIEAGTITDTIPGVVIDRLSDGVRVVIDDAPAKTFSKDGARIFAASIREAVGQGTGTVNVDHGFGVVRRGTGYSITAPFRAQGGEAFNGDLAVDLARLLDEAAA